MWSYRPASPRGLLLTFVGLLFLLTAGTAIWRVLALRDLAIERERTRLQSLAEDQVERFENTILAELWDLTGQVAENPERAAALQRKLRGSKEWFDALFLWRPGEGEMWFPQPSAPGSAVQMQTSLCLARAHYLERERPDDLDAIVAEYVDGCRTEEPTVRLYAGKQAAHHLVGQQRLDDALAVLDATALQGSLTVREAAGSLGVNPFELATHRLARVEIRRLRDPEDALALDLAATLGRELTELEAPDLGAAGVPMNQILRLLGRVGREDEVEELKQGFGRADRRFGAYKQVLDRLLGEPPRPGPRVGRIVLDPYSEHPFLLHYGWTAGPPAPGAAEGRLLGVAFSLEEAALVNAFLENGPRALRGATTVTDARTNRWVGGAKLGGRYVTGAQFRRTLTHLRVNVRQSALEAAVGASREQWMVPLVVICVSAALGVALLVALDRTTRQQVELLERQRAFGTRVTHELKTPLAGIKVMAENLEIGAFKDERQREEMAHRIVQEADRLTRRVDEVLAAAKERTIPSPVPFDPEEIVYGLVEEWEPRMVDAGITFEVDPAPTDPVLGDPAALRDAIACLLDNALKYRREGVASKVRMTLHQEGNQVVLTVLDNGLGVPRNMRRRVFERFVRVEGPNRGTAGGHGLGLSQVREIVQAHRGTVTCADGLDGGSAFVVRVPAHTAG
jgi:signal transduction histidine kinase